MTDSKRSNYIIDWFVVLLLSVASAAVVLWQNSRLTVLWDLSYILENSYRISIGQLPYRDFPFPYAPVTFLTQAALIKLTGRVFFHHVIYCAVVAAISTVLTWRILLKVLIGVQHSRFLAIILTLPLVVLGIYSIFPHPFYDPDCSLAVEICLLLMLQWDTTGSKYWLPFVTGLLLPIPIFIKQNTGLAFVLSALAAFTFLFALDIWRHRSIRRYFLLTLGVATTLVFALGLIHFTAGLSNYIRWTVRFAAERRTPAWAEMLGIYTESHLKWWLAVFLAGAMLAYVKRDQIWLKVVSATLLTLPFIWPAIYLFIDHDSSERAERLLNLWPLVILISILFLVLTFRRRSNAEFLFTISIIGMVHGAFLSQQLWGSTYALWPFFFILLALIVKWFGALSIGRKQLELNIQPVWVTAICCVVSLSMLTTGYLYLRSHERLDYANLDDGDITHSKLPALKGLSMRGSWIPDFEELVAYVDSKIPHDEGILCLPGEDLFYYTTGRRPQFPVLMFDHTVNPLSPQEIVDTARQLKINWLITKDDLQLEEEPLEKKDELMKLLAKEFESVESLDNYEIYKRKSPDSNDSDDDDSNDDQDEPSQKP